ncbi:hypothetical protein KC337_g103 [Hortaea werneckii]|nr:hypothetical protein KC337_g103 [Hortaea werneckii]
MKDEISAICIARLALPNCCTVRENKRYERSVLVGERCIPSTSNSVLLRHNMQNEDMIHRGRGKDTSSSNRSLSTTNLASTRHSSRAPRGSAQHLSTRSTPPTRRHSRLSRNL